MSFEATNDILNAMLGIEKRKKEKLREIPEIEKIIQGLSGQMESYESTTYFLIGRQVYIGYEQMLLVQRDFSTKHDHLTFEHDWDIPRLFPEIKKVIELLERFRVHQESETDVDRVLSYLSTLHSFLCAQQMGPRKGCFG